MRYLLTLCLGCFLMTAHAQTIHLFGCFDTDTVGDMTTKGHKRTIEKLTLLKQNLESAGVGAVQLHLLQYPNATVPNLLNLIKQTPTQPNDAIVCLLGAHGYNDGQSREPRIIFPDPNIKTNELAKKSINLQEFAQIVFQKSARFKLVLGEACNVVIPLKEPKKKGRDVAAPYLKEAIQRYFQQATGEIIIWSSSKNEGSYIDSEGGGFYSRHFFEVLNEHLSDRNYKNQTWELLLNQAESRTHDYAEKRGKSQTPDKSFKGVRYDSNQLPEAITKGELPSAHLGFSLAVKTDRGRENVTYSEGDTMRVFAEVSKPSYLMMVYQFADGSNTLLLDNYYIPETDTKKFAKINREFVCWPPFGKENLICFASDTPFAPIPPQLIKKDSGITFLLGPIADVVKTIRKNQTDEIAKKRGMKPTEVSNSLQEGLLEDKIPILTKTKK